MSPSDLQVDMDSPLDALWSTVQNASDLGTAALGLGPREHGPRYKAFISYSHRDERIARWLHRRMELFPIPKALIGATGKLGPVPRRLRPIFRDEDELAGAAELGPVIEEAIRDSAALLVICSPASARSEWVGREIRLFKEVNPHRPVLAVIADGVPGDPDQECFPEALRLVHGPDGTLRLDPDFEPLAPDLCKQDRRMVLLKLIAGLTGVKYNDLFRRDRRRLQRTITAFAIAGLAIIAALTVLSVAAVRSERMAVKERNAARAAQALAERNADLAERRAWLAQTAAIEVRRQSLMLGSKTEPRQAGTR